jgi:KaiC/GvpD/RAD55 family RecA-like ATPase
MKFITANELMDMPLPPIKHLAKGLFEEQALVYIAGTPGSSKTMFMINFALCGAVGKSILGQFPVEEPFSTLFIDEENGLRRTKHKLLRLSKGLGIRTDLLKFACMENFLLEDSRVRELEQAIMVYKPKAVVIDSFVRVLMGSERDEKDVRKVHELLKPLIEKYGVTIFILHHLRKADVNSKNPTSLDDIRGSGDIGGQCDQAFLLSRFGIEENKKLFNCTPIKEKDGLEGGKFGYYVNGAVDSETLEIGWSGYISEIAKDARERIENDIIEFIKEKGSVITNDIKKGVKGGNSKKMEILKELLDEGKVNVKRRGKTLEYY